MATKISAHDPVLGIEFFLSGFYTHRSQLFAPFKGIGVNVVSFHDPVIDGANMEDTDLYEWSRRPGFSLFNTDPLGDQEIVNQFYGFRNLNGTVIALFDSTARLATFDDTVNTTIITKTGTSQGYINPVGSMCYFSDGVSVDMQKWLSTQPLSAINPSSWGLPAPTLTPTISNHGCWLPFTNFILSNAVLDPNGNVEVVTATYGGSGVSGGNQPLWPTTTASTINDGSIQWTNMGPLDTWLPETSFPVPVVVLDTNGNLQLATATTSGVIEWNAATTYAVGSTVFFGGNYWTSVINSNTNIPPSAGYAVVSGSTTQPAWQLSQNPITTGTVAPAWNKTVGGTTPNDGAYTWTNLGPGNLVESFGTSYVYCWRTIYGHLTTASPASLNTGSIFGPTIVTITSFSITNNVVTFLGANNFVPGNIFSLQGMSNGTYLNNQSFIVLANGLSPTQFSAVFDFADVPSTVDSGSTENLIANVQGVGNTSPLCNATSSITATQVVAGVVTIYGQNNYAPGLWVTFGGLTVATFLNNVQLQISNVDPDNQWFQVFYTTSLGIVPPDQAQTTDTGTVTFNAVEIYRVSDGGGIYLFAGAVTNPMGVTPLPYDSGDITAGKGVDNAAPGTFPWVNPNNVTSTTNFATVAIPTPSGSGTARFIPVQVCQNMLVDVEAGGNASASFGTSVTAGNDIVVVLSVFDVASWTIRDSNNNSYTLVKSQAAPNDHGIVTNQTYVAKNCAAGPTTITLSVVPNASSTNFFGFGAIECNGFNGTTEASTNSIYQASGTTLSSGSITTTNANSVVFSFVWSDLTTLSGSPATPPSGFTQWTNQVVHQPPNGNSYQQMTAAYQVQTATGTFNPRWATPANSKGIGITCAFDLSLSAPSDGLNATTFNFAVPNSITISGIEIDFDAEFTGAVNFGVLTVQLLKAGAPYGNIMQVLPTGSIVTYTLGGANTLWGGTWLSSDFSNAQWGVQIIASQLTGGSNGTFSVRNVRARLTGGTSTTGWVYNDFTTDANLDILLVAPQAHLNDPPPGAPGSSVNQIVGTITAYWSGRIWMAVGNYVYFTAGPDCTNGIPEEAWPPANRFQFAGPVIGLTPTPDGAGLLVYLADRVNAILGGPETISFYPTDALSNFGITNTNALFRDDTTLGQFTTQAQYFELHGGQKAEIGEHVSDYLTANFPSASTYVTMHRDGLDVGVFLSNGSDQILRYGSNIGAWSVPAYPLTGAGALRSIETSVGTFSLMLGNPTGGATTNTALLDPALGVSGGGAEVPWTNPGNITAGSPTSYATVTLASTAISSSVIQSFLQSGFINGSNTFNTTLTPENVAPFDAGDTIFAYFTIGSTSGSYATVQTITDTQGNVWARVIPDQQFPTSVGYLNNLQLWSAVLLAGVANPSTLVVTTTFDHTANGGGVSFFVARNIGGILAFNQNTGFVGNVPPSVQPFSDPLVVTAPAVVLALSGGNFYGPINTFPAGYSIPSPFEIDGAGGGAAAFQLSGPGTYSAQWNVQLNGNSLPWGTTLIAFAQIVPTPQSAQALNASKYPVNIPLTAVVQGVEVQVTGKANNSALPLTIQPINPQLDAEVDTFTFTSSNTTQTFGGPKDLWGMESWASPNAVNAADFGFQINSTAVGESGELDVSLVRIIVYYQNPGNYLRYRDLTTWADSGVTGQQNGVSYEECYITLGNITLTALGGDAFALQHIVGYFNAVGTGGAGGAATKPDIWIMPNEVSDTTGIGFVYLPETQPEPPQGQNYPSKSIQALRWPVNAVNSDAISQYVHHLQVKIMFESENAQNTIKAIAFKREQ